MKLEDVIFARYHPTRKFHLAMSSFKGKVSIMDLSCKKTVFLEKNAHDAPCREISIPEDIPDRLLTCGCDSFVKIYDMRKKAAGIQIQSNCGFTTISSSKCGGFFVVGNLKGDLISYDMRDLKKPLSITKGDGVLITRVAFLKENFEHPDNMEPMSSEHAEQVSDELPDPPEDQDDFSCLEQILEINKGRPSEFDCSSRVSAIGNHKVNEDRRGSALFGHNLANAFNFSINLESNTDEISLPESPSANFSESMKRIGKKDSSSRRRSSYLPSCLQLIHEENGDKENLCLNSPNALSSAGPRFSSTPASSIRFNNKDNTVLPSENLDSSEEIIDVDALDSFGNNENSNVSQEKQATLLAPVLLTSRIDFNKEFEAVRDAMRFEIQSLNFDLSGRHIETMTYVFNQRKALENRIARIEDCIGILMNEDAKIARVMDLIEENASLKVQLSSAFRQIKNFQNNEVPKTE